MRNQRRQVRRRQRGIVLVTVLLLTMILALVLMEFSFTAKVDLFAARNALRSLGTRCAFISGGELARAALEARYQGGDSRADRDRWELPGSFQINGLTVVVEATDEDGKFPGVLLLPRSPHERSVFSAREYRQAEEAVKGWLEEMGCRQQDVWFPVLQPVMRELRWAASAGSGSDVLGLAEVPTFWTDGRINVNAASRETLRAAVGRTAADVVDCILAGRSERRFASEQELTARLSGCDEGWELSRSRLKVTSALFRVRVTALDEARGHVRTRTSVLARAGRSFVTRVAYDEPVPRGPVELP